MVSGLGTTFLWIGTVGMLLGLLAFVAMTASAREENKAFYYITALIPLIAVSMYFAMALAASNNGGFGVAKIDGHPFFYARYIDWVFTTPLLLLDIALIALPAGRGRFALIGTLIAADIYMILTGLIGGLTTGPAKYAWWGASCVAFALILYVIVTRLFAAARSQDAAVGGLVRTLGTVILVLWTAYPIVWLLGTEGLSLFGSDSLTVEIILYAILDVSAKVGFGFLLLSNRKALDRVGAGTLVASAAR